VDKIDDVASSYSKVSKMATIIRNICNKRSNESLLILQKNGTFLEQHCSTEPGPRKQRIWLDMNNWITHLRKTGKLGTIGIYSDDWRGDGGNIQVIVKE